MSVVHLSLGDYEPWLVINHLRAGCRCSIVNHVIEQIEAQTKPPRIPEPGLWGVVEAGVKQHDVRLRWVRLGDNYRPNDDGEYDRLWSDLIDPVLVRDGIEDGAK